MPITHDYATLLWNGISYSASPDPEHFSPGSYRIQSRREGEKDWKSELGVSGCENAAEALGLFVRIYLPL